MTDILATKRRVLAEQLDLGVRAAAALQHTWRKLDPELFGESDPDLLEALEALTARFARLEDILLKRVFRAVAAVELSDAERLLDVLDFEGSRQAKPGQNRFKGTRSRKPAGGAYDVARGVTVVTGRGD
jgi:hypothetical protein